MLPLAEIETEASARQDVEPPVTVGAVGSVRSIRSVACTQFERRPTPSIARNCTSVWPSAVADLDVPEVIDDQVVPPSVDVRYS